MGHYECRRCDQRLDECTCVPEKDLRTLAPSPVASSRFWSLTEGDALACVRTIEEHTSKVGWHVGICGSVLYKGGSMKDLDMIAFPHKKKGFQCQRKGALHAALVAAGLKLRIPHKKLRKLPPKGGTKRDRKWVEIWETSEGRRVDLIVLS